MEKVMSGMTKYINPKISSHMRYYSNPLKPIRSIWKLQLFFYSYKDLKRVSQRSKYQPIRMRLHNIGSSRDKRNPVTWILESKNERKVWGKFNR